VIEYALAQLWMSWGIQPQALIGHSIGEYVAACLAGVFSLKDALTLVAARGRMMQNLPAGAMLSIPLPEADVRPLLGADLDLAAVNAPTSCVVSGAEHAIGALLQRLDAQGIQSRRLQTSHAFHSTMMEPILEPFAQLVAAARPQAPQIPFISNVSGAWITEAEATDARYWARHLRQPVRFADGVNTLMEAPARVLLEVGPGTTLSVFARQNAGQPAAFSTLPHPNDRRSALEVALTALGRLWLAGVRMNWPLLHASARRRRIPLPTYPFERQRHWLLEAPIHVSERSFASNKKADVSQWLYTPVWQRQALPSPEASSTADQAQRWLIFSDPYGIGDGLTEHLRERGRRVIRVLPGERFARCDDDRYTLDPHQADQYAALLDELSAQSSAPQRIVHCWSLDAARATEVQLDAFEQAQDLGYYSLLFLAQALGKQLPGRAVELTVVTNDTRRVTGAEILRPERATVGGPCLVIPQEHPTIICRQIDIDTPAPDGPTNADVIQQLTSEVFATPLDVAVAYRGAERWVQSFEAIESTAVAETQPPAKLRERGVYLITGGLGGIGLALANYLTRAARARLVLLGRTALPERAEWDGWLAAHTPDDPISARIRAVQALEAQGTEVLVVSADVADADEMRAAVRLAEQRFGAIHGVIHSAGTARGSWFKAIGETGRAESDRHFQPKVYGLLGLTQALRGRSLDFCILQSSLASVLGGLGNVAYAAANQFLDVYAQQQPDGTPWISINWDSWHNQDDQEHGIGATLVNLAITPDEGAQAFQQILALPDTPQVIVSTADLHARVAQWVRLEHLRVAQSPGASALSRTNGSLAGRLELESAITEIWQRVLGAPHVGLHDNFFDLGGNSLSGMQLIAELKRVLDVQLAPVALFEAPTVSALARLIQPNADAELERTTSPMRADTTEDAAIAIIGMAGRFPGAETLDLFWQNLRAGVESITFFSDDELRASGIPPALLRDPAYVKARPILDDVAGFDAAFFGYAPREAELMDPQHRLFLECAWHALEDAGYATDDQRESIGIFGGASISTYLLNLCMTTDLVASVDPLQTVIGNDKDSLTTSVSYKLNLTGPSMAVQTFCSTSLVAVHLACQSLQRGECSMALAGGVSIVVPQQSGYHYQPDGIVSPDGHCRSFDAQAQGTLFGNGVGLVLLKPLAAAQRDGDHIYAVLKGSAINNDGALKVGYTAPSVDGQAAVIRAAQQAAGVAPDTITYLETHGTGTALGDPIEVAALTKAFRAQTDQTGFCALGALKPNVGHLDRAAGVAALIKAVLALRQQEIPPVAHFTAPNPACDLANSPFYVPTAPTPWAAGATPRRAGVSALGFGGTNAHVIVEEAPAQDASGPGRPWLLLPLAAKSAAALAQASANLATYLAQHPETPLADVAYTLQVGRRAFQHRRILVCRDHADAIEALRSGDPRRVFNDTQESRERPIAFMFSGQGSQHVGMGGQLYDHETVFREHIDRCCELLLPHLGRDLRTLLYPDADQADVAADELRQTALTQPALFVIEYALAQLWMSWGIRPHALIGHSVGEYVAACLAGVFTLEDALALVAARGRLMQNLPTGAMLSVPLPENELRRILGETAHAEGSNGASAPAVFVSDHATMQAHIPLLPAAIAQQLALAAINTPSQSVVAGPEEAIVALEQHLARGQVDTRRLQTSHAFHSAMMDPILEPFAQLIAAARPQAPQIPLISNVSGDWMTDAEATDPHYWARHLRQPVRFAAGVATLLLAPDRALLEVGPGQTLTTLARRHPARSPRQSVIASMRHPREHTDDLAFLLTALGRLWLSGATIDWTHFTAHERRQRVPLPHYPFDHQRYWIDSDPAALASNSRRTSEGKRADIGDWFYLPSWKRTITPKPQPTASTIEPRAWLLFVDESGVGEALAQRLTQSDQDVTIVRPGAGFTQIDERRYTIDPGRSADYDALMAALQRQERLPHTIAHLWSIAERTATAQTRQAFEQAQQYGFYSMLFLTQALAKTAPTHAAQLVVITNQLHSVTAEESAQPEKAPILGLCAVIPQEYPHLSCRAIDLSAPRHRFGRAVDQLLAECLAPAAERVVAYRGAQRWVQTFEPMRLEADDATVRDLREQGIYLITDGLDGIGLGIAAYLARTVKAKLALIERDELPPREEWAALAAQPEGQSAISDKIRRALALEAHGAEVLTLHADTTDAEQLRHAIDAAITRFGALHGVIHAAGVIGERLFRAIQETTPAECAWHFAPKIYSLFALEQALDDREIDFCLLVSSLACFLGGRGYTAYAASDLFMDSFAQNHNKHHPTPWISVNWDAWQFEGARLTSITADLAQFAMSQDEGGEAFRRIVTMNTADQVAVSTGDLVSRLATWARKIDTLRDQLNPESEAATPRHPRPTLQTPYVAPQTEIERAIADIWQRALGFEQVGVHDNFFDLGGDSFIAIRVVARLKETFDKDISAVSLYEGPTISALSKLVTQDETLEAAPEEQEAKLTRRKQYRHMKRSRRELQGDMLND
jgi:acyl transferase domain-containing protein/acyl carrier protein